MLLRRHRRFQPIQEPKQEPIVEEVKETREVPKYTKTDIFRMNKAKLVEAAKEIGIEDAEELNGNELKSRLMKHYV